MFYDAIAVTCHFTLEAYYFPCFTFTTIKLLDFLEGFQIGFSGCQNIPFQMLSQNPAQIHAIFLAILRRIHRNTLMVGKTQKLERARGHNLNWCRRVTCSAGFLETPVSQYNGRVDQW